MSAKEQLKIMLLKEKLTIKELASILVKKQGDITQPKVFQVSY